MISRTQWFVFLVIVWGFPLRCIADHQERLRIHSSVLAGPGKYLHVEPKKVLLKFRPADGFPEAVVNQFAQSDCGAIWMATEFGLHSYDGYQVQHFDTGAFQDAVCIDSMVRDGHEEIWLGTTAGLAILTFRERLIACPEQFRGIEIHCIGVDHLGRRLVGTASGLFVRSGEEFLQVESALQVSAVRSTEMDLKTKTTWVGTDQGLCKLQGQKLVPQALPEIDDLPICEMHLDRLGALWVGTDQSVLRIRSGEVTEVHSQDTARLDYVSDFVETESELRVSLANAIVNIPAEELNADSPIPEVTGCQNGPSSEFIDCDGNRWSGVVDKSVLFVRAGLTCFSSRRCNRVARQPDSDAIWFSTDAVDSNPNLFRIQNGERQRWKFDDRIVDFAWHNKRLLVGTENGVFQLDGNQAVPHPSPKLEGKSVFDMSASPDGSLWLATDQGVYRIYKGKVTKHESSVGFGLITRVLATRKVLTLATEAKVLHYDSQDNLLEEIDLAQGVASRQIKELMRTKDGQLWVGTTFGLFCQNQVGDPMVLAFGRDRLHGSYLAEANDGRFWAGTRSGPCRIDRKTKVTQTLHPEDVFGPENVLHCMVDGDYTWFAGESGLWRYRSNTDAPKLFIDRITTDRELAVNEPVVATTDNGFLTVSFHAITPGLRPGSTLYRYRLIGQSDQWSEADGNQVELRDLPVGDYSFELQAFDINMAASEIVTVPIAVSVPAMRYATYAAFFASLMLALLSFGYVVYYQRRQNNLMAKQVTEAVNEQLRLKEGLRQSQKLESLGTLASGMAHDFNNALHVISACSEMAALDDHGDPKLIKNLTMIQDAASQAQSLTRSMLTLAGNQPRQSEVVDLVNLTSDCLAMIRQATPQSIEFTTQLDSKQPMLVEVDPEQIKQVLVNLFLNARDAMPGGGILTVSTQTIMTDNQPLAQVEVRDSGSGIGPETLERIFEPFYTTKSRGKGTGLGLAMAQGIIRAHGGAIAVRSVEGHGACFTVCLPQTTSASKNTTPKEPASRPKQPIVAGPVVAAKETADSKMTVLVADDHEPVRQMLVEILKSNHAHVLTADNGARALELACKQHPDILVLDIDMPVLDGLTALRKIRSSGYETPAILISGAPLLDALPHKTELLMKPFTAEQLLQATAKHGHRPPPSWKDRMTQHAVADESV